MNKDELIQGMKTGGGEEFYEVEENFKQMLKDSED